MLEKLPVFFLGFSIPRFLGNPKKTKNQTGLKPGNLTWKREFCAEGKAGIPSQTSGLGFIPRIWESLRHKVVPSAWKKFGISRKTPVFSQSQRPGESCGCGRDIPGNPGIPPSQKKWEFPLGEFQLGIQSMISSSPYPRGFPAFPGNSLQDQTLGFTWTFPPGKAAPEALGIPGKFLGFSHYQREFGSFSTDLFCFVSFPKFLMLCFFSFFPPGCCWWISWSFPGIFLEFSWNSLRAGWPGWWWGRSGPGTGLGGVHPST